MRHSYVKNGRYIACNATGGGYNKSMNKQQADVAAEKAEDPRRAESEEKYGSKNEDEGSNSSGKQHGGAEGF